MPRWGRNKLPLGPGKYDDLATSVRHCARAEGVIVIVIKGDSGSGFSVQANLEITLALPTMLRDMAEEIEKSMRHQE